MRLRCILALACLLPLSVAASELPEPSENDRLRYSKACNHYVNRARFTPRGDANDFFATLADGCTDAEIALGAQSAPKRRAAAAFLGNLAELRDIVVQINMERMFGADWNRYSKPKNGAKARTETLGQVSRTGEYLIAHRMGLIAAFKAWKISDRDVSLADAIERGGKPAP